MSSVPEVVRQEQAGTVELDAVLWKRAVQIISDRAYHLLKDKELGNRIAAGTALALDRTKVVFDASDETWRVAGSPKNGRTEAVWHSVNGSCTCSDFVQKKAPDGLCKHRLAAMLTKRARTMRPEDLTSGALGAEFGEPLRPAPPEDQQPAESAAQGDEEEEGWPQEDASVADERPGMVSSPAPGLVIEHIPPQYIQLVHGRPFVRYFGLLAMAHAQGLHTLEATFVSITETFAVAQATATFLDGRRFVECGDATPENVHVGVRPHFARLALTRAKARALRDALNIGICSLEELHEEEPTPVPEASEGPPKEGYCAVHNSAMRSKEKDGQGWWWHKVGDTFCHGNGGR